MKLGLLFIFGLLFIISGASFMLAGIFKYIRGKCNNSGDKDYRSRFKLLQCEITFLVNVIIVVLSIWWYRTI